MLQRTVFLLSLGLLACGGGAEPDGGGGTGGGGGGGGSGGSTASPVISNLTVLTAPVERATQEQVRLDLRDDDGIGKVMLKLELSGAAKMPVDVDVPDMGEITESEVTFYFTIPALAPSGDYNMAVTAVDSTDNESNELSFDFNIPD